MTTKTEPISLAHAIDALKDRPWYFDEPQGNNGDDLIVVGCRVAMERAGVKLVDRPEDAGVIAFRGGGMMNDIYRSGREPVQRHSERFPDKDLLIMPQSYKFETTNFPDLLRGRTAPAWLIARDYTSLAIVEAMDFSGIEGGVRIGLDHDMAMHLRGSKWLDDLKARGSNDHILVVERGDNERPGGRIDVGTGIPSIFKKLAPSGLKASIKRSALEKKTAEAASSSTLVATAREILAREHPEAASIPIKYGDVSNRSFASFEEFCERVTKAAVVFSDRMHVGILGTLLGKPTYIRPASYHKIQAVYEYTLKPEPNVQLLPPIHGTSD